MEFPFLLSDARAGKTATVLTQHLDQIISRLSGRTCRSCRSTWTIPRCMKRCFGLDWVAELCVPCRSGPCTSSLARIRTAGSICNEHMMPLSRSQRQAAEKPSSTAQAEAITDGRNCGRRMHALHQLYGPNGGVRSNRLFLVEQAPVILGTPRIPNIEHTRRSECGRQISRCLRAVPSSGHCLRHPQKRGRLVCCDSRALPALSIVVTRG